MSDLPTVKDIRRLLFSIRRKWYDIGIELDVDSGVLDTIRDTHTDPKDCLTEMIKKLKKSNLTWKALAEALRAEPVDELEIAQKADEKHNQCSTPQTCLVTRTHKKESRLGDIFDDIDENFQYPLLKVQNLTDKEVEQLKIRLNSDTRTICCSFASLAGGVATCLKDSRVTAEDLKSFFIHGEFDSLADFIDISDNIPTVMTKVKRKGYWSFFNYEILETVIRRYCMQLISELEDYKSNFEIYCRRRVSEVPVAILKRGESTTSSPQSATEFCVKLDDRFSISTSSMISVKDVAYKIQKILNIKMPLQIVDVQSGCILLTLRYFGKSSTLFPLDEEQKSSLAKVGVCRIYCSEYEVKLKNGPHLDSEAPMSAFTHDHTSPQPSSAPATTASVPTHDHTPPQPSSAPATTASAPMYDHTPPQPSSAPATTASAPMYDHAPPQPSSVPGTTPMHDHTPLQQPPSSVPSSTPVTTATSGGASAPSEFCVYGGCETPHSNPLHQLDTKALRWKVLRKKDKLEHQNYDSLSSLCHNTDVVASQNMAVEPPHMGPPHPREILDVSPYFMDDTLLSMPSSLPLFHEELSPPPYPNSTYPPPFSVPVTTASARTPTHNHTPPQQPPSRTTVSAPVMHAAAQSSVTVGSPADNSIKQEHQNFSFSLSSLYDDSASQNVAVEPPHMGPPHPREILVEYFMDGTWLSLPSSLPLKFTHEELSSPPYPNSIYPPPPPSGTTARSPAHDHTPLQQLATCDPDWNKSMLGAGSYGTVYRADWNHQSRAAKIIRGSHFLPPDIPGKLNHAKQFEKECQLLSQFRYPHIVQCLGVQRDHDTRLPVLLMELMDNKLLAALLEEGVELSNSTKLSILHDVSSAITYLHSKDIIHRDISSNNVLMRGNVAKLADWGASVLTDPARSNRPMQCLMPPKVYMPPDLVSPSPEYTEKIDCFEFGVLALQVLMVLKDESSEILRLASEIDRLEEHKKIPNNHPMFELICKCLKDKATERPFATEICCHVARLQQTEKAEEGLKAESAVRRQQEDLQRAVPDQQVQQVLECDLFDRFKKFEDKLNATWKPPYSMGRRSSQLPQFIGRTLQNPEGVICVLELDSGGGHFWTVHRATPNKEIDTLQPRTTSALQMISHPKDQLCWAGGAGITTTWKSTLVNRVEALIREKLQERSAALAAQDHLHHVSSYLSLCDRLISTVHACLPQQHLQYLSDINVHHDLELEAPHVRIVDFGLRPNLDHLYHPSRLSLCDKPTGKVLTCVRQKLLQYLQYLSDVKVHCDLELENVLRPPNVPIPEFGCSRMITENLNKLMAGTRPYLAPEKTKGYKESLDVWSFGVTLYEMAHMDPFNEDEETADQIHHAYTFVYHPDPRRSMPSDAVNFIHVFLRKSFQTSQDTSWPPALESSQSSLEADTVTHLNWQTTMNFFPYQC